jgi:hypothetical protein
MRKETIKQHQQNVNIKWKTLNRCGGYKQNDFLRLVGNTREEKLTQQSHGPRENLWTQKK